MLHRFFNRIAGRTSARRRVNAAAIEALAVCITSLSARKATPFADRHGIGGSFRHGAVRLAPNLPDRRSESDCGLVGARKSAPVVVFAPWAINLRERPLAKGLQEGEIKQELQNGGHLRNVLIITK